MSLFLSISIAPTISVNTVIILSVEARSITVSWDEVPCSGQNGPITGYLVYYINATFSGTSNITGGNNRQSVLTALTPNTNYTVTVRAFNDVGIGPASSEVIQRTKEAGKSIIMHDALYICFRTWCGIQLNTNWYRYSTNQHYMECTNSTQWCHNHI